MPKRGKPSPKKPAHRPKTTRYYNGVLMADHLYRDNKGRVDYWRYRLPDLSFTKPFHCSIHEANRHAISANARRDAWAPPAPAEQGVKSGSWRDFFDRYIEWREEQSPKLAGTRSWNNRGYVFNEFCESFADVPVNHLTLKLLIPWWDDLTHHNQKLRQAELRRFFTWMQRSGHCQKLKHNPFTRSDELPRLEVKPCPSKIRTRLTPREFATTYQEAGRRGYTGLQLAMTLSLLTTMREGDILKLRFADVSKGNLRVTISKSEAQRGKANAARLEWSLAERPRLAALINQARERSLQLERCPYIVAWKPQAVRASRHRTHKYQMLPRQLTDQFAECRPDRPNPPTFHEVRSLAAALMNRHGVPLKDLQTLLAHGEGRTTLGYLDDHELPYLTIQVPELDAVTDFLKL
jgi:integrase